MCVWSEPALLRDIKVPIGTIDIYLLTSSLSTAGPALLRALAVPRDLTGTIQSDRHYSTGTTEGPVLYVAIIKNKGARPLSVVSVIHHGIYLTPPHVILKD